GGGGRSWRGLGGDGRIGGGPGDPVGQGDQDQQRAGVGVGHAAGQDAPERLAGNPDQQPHHHGGHDHGAHDRGGQVHRHRQQAEHHGQPDREGQAAVGGQRTGAVDQRGQPVRLTGGHGGDVVVHALGSPV